MQFQVPQFIDIEDKIIGPLTLRQFLYLLAGGVVLFVLYQTLNLFVFFLLACIVVPLSIAFAFVKINNQPFGAFIKNMLGFLKKPDYYVWKKTTIKNQTEEKSIPELIQKAPAEKKLKTQSKERLQEINWRIEVEK